MVLPATMKCIEIQDAGPNGTLVLGERPLPAVGPTEVLIRVAAAGINRPDVI